MPRRTPLPHSLRGRPFTAADAKTFGLSRGRLRGADLDHDHYGVYSEGLDAWRLIDRCRALAVVLSPTQAYSHATAMTIYRAPLPWAQASDAPLHVMSHTDRPPVRRAGVIGWETEATITIHHVDGLPVCAPADVWVQLAVLGAGRGRMGLTPEWLVAVGDFLVSGARTDLGRAAPLASLAELAAAAAAHRGKRGAKGLRWALPMIRTGVDSPKETELRLGLIAAGLPEPVTQFAVRTSAGWLHADLGYGDARLLLEYQGERHRTDRDRWMKDLTRLQLFEDAGYRTIQVTAADLEPGSLSALTTRVHRALASRTFDA